MKKILIVIVLLIASYFFWQKAFHDNRIDALYNQPYVVVYGRDGCGWTQKYLKDLNIEGIKVIYKNVDGKKVSEELHPRMEKAGLDTRRFSLPVIDVNAVMLIRPDLKIILEAYEKYK